MGFFWFFLGLMLGTGLTGEQREAARNIYGLMRETMSTLDRDSPEWFRLNKASMSLRRKFDSAFSS